MEPLISVIVPVYNVEEYVEACIQSIIAQTYRNIEIIIVSDGQSRFWASSHVRTSPPTRRRMNPRRAISAAKRLTLSGVGAGAKISTFVFSGSESAVSTMS